MREIIRTRIGSHCHGTNMPESDTDIRTIFIPPRDYFVGLKTCKMYEEKQDGKDIEHWNVSKLIRLALKGNPSALNVIFANKKDLFYVDEWGQRILDVRDRFLSQRSITSVIGYCTSQLHKLTIGRGSKIGKRSLMIEKYGYDVKFCYHAVMLTNMGIELVRDGRYEPLRKDIEQQYLKKIRRGLIPLEEIRHQIRENLETIKTLEPICPLPKNPDETWANEFMTNFIWDYLTGGTP